MCLSLCLCFSAGSEAYHICAFWLKVCVCVQTLVCKKNPSKQRNTPPPMIFLSLQWYLSSNLSEEGIIALSLASFTSGPCMIFLPSTPQVEIRLLNFLKTFGMLTFLLAQWHEGAWSDLFHSCCYRFFTFAEQTNKIHFARFSKTTFPIWPKPGAFRIKKACHV